MSKMIIKPISITEETWEKGKKASKEFYGHENFSGYVSFLIREANKKNNDVLDLVMLTPDSIAKHLEWDNYHHMMINEEHIDHQLKEAINMLFFTNKLEVPFG